MDECCADFTAQVVARIAPAQLQEIIMRNFDLSFDSSFFSPAGNLALAAGFIPSGIISSVGAARTHRSNTAERTEKNSANVPVDIAQTEKAYLLTADLPGVDPTTIEVSVHDGQLRLKGERLTTSKAESEAEGIVVNRRERRTGPFERSFTIPKGVSVDAIEVSAAHGVLKITIPKQEAQVRKRIAVKAPPVVGANTA